MTLSRLDIHHRVKKIRQLLKHPLTYVPAEQLQEVDKRLAQIEKETDPYELDKRSGRPHKDARIVNALSKLQATEEKPVSAAELAQYIGMSPSHASVAVHRAQRRGQPIGHTSGKGYWLEDPQQSVP